MTSIQKVIKTCAIIFAIFLICNISIGILTFAGTFLHTTGFLDSFQAEERMDFNETYEESNIQNIRLEIGVSKVNILTGDVLKVEAQNVNKNFQVISNGNTLTVKEKEKNYFLNEEHASTINIYLPSGMALKRFDFNAGVGDTYIENIIAERIDLDLGVGNTKIVGVITDHIDLDAGVGNIEVSNSTLKDADIDCGVGDLYLEGALVNRSKISCGLGNVTLLLNTLQGEYELDVDKGVGNITLNGKSLSDHEKYGNGANRIKIDGGMGNIDIRI